MSLLQSNDLQNNVTRILTVGLCSVVFAICLAGLAAGSQMAVRALVAALIALVPAGFAHWAAQWSFTRDVNWQLIAVLGGGAIRTFATLIVALIVYFAVPICQTLDFWFWLSAFYLAALACEVVSLLETLQVSRNGPARTENQQQLGNA